MERKIKDILRHSRCYGRSMGNDMSKMKDYYEFLQMLYRLETGALAIMLEYEDDNYKRQLIQGEIEARAPSKETELIITLTA